MLPSYSRKQLADVENEFVNGLIAYHYRCGDDYEDSSGYVARSEGLSEHSDTQQNGRDRFQRPENRCRSGTDELDRFGRAGQ